MIDLFVFSLGMAWGAIVMFVWIRASFKKYVLPCSNANCPHHRRSTR